MPTEIKLPPGPEHRRVLVLVKNIPWPANSGEKQRTLGIVRALGAIGRVTIVGFAGVYDDPAAGTTEGFVVRSITPPGAGPLQTVAGAIPARSITVGKYQSREMSRVVAEEMAAGVDLLVVEHIQLHGYLPARASATVTVLDMHNIESQLTRRLADTRRLPVSAVLRAESVALAALERRRVNAFDVVSVASAADRSTLLKQARPSGQPIVVPNAWEPTGKTLPFPSSPAVCFVGLMSWAPNENAVLAFVDKVWPLVLAEIPDAAFLIVGRNPGEAVKALASQSITVSGTVEDVEPWYERAQVAVAPLNAGGGSRLKILEALAFGRPVVASPIGAEGLEDLSGRGLIISEDPVAMAADISRLLREPEQANKLGLQGAEAVLSDHSWQSATAPLLTAVRQRLEEKTPKAPDPAVTESRDFDVIVPLRNEAHRMPEFLAMLQAQTLTPKKIIVADGMSEDGSRTLLEQAQGRFPGLVVVDNPERTVPAALNAALARVTSPVVARMDTHAEYAPDYLETLVGFLAERPDVSGVGGSMETAGRGAWGGAIASTLGRGFGLGGARHRVGGADGEIQHVFSGCYRTSALTSINGWDTRFLANEDFEADTRIGEAGGLMWLNTQANSTWFVRETPKALAIQMWRYGFYKGLTLRLHPSSASPRQLAPPGLVILLIAGVLGRRRETALMAGSYAVLTATLGARAARSDGASIVRGSVVPAIVHLSWGSGLLAGLARFSLARRRMT